MFHMEHQGNIQYLCLQLGIFHVRPQKSQQIFSCAQLRIRMMDIHTFILFIMVVRVISVYCQHREYADQHHTLAQHIFHTQIRYMRIIGRQRQHALCHRIHNVPAGRFHNNISYKICRQTAHGAEHFRKLLQLDLIRQFSEQQQICGFFKSRPFICDNPSYQIVDIISSVCKLASARHCFPVYDLF